MSFVLIKTANGTDDYLQCRQAVTETTTKLSERAHQFRSIQKRLLVRFKVPSLPWLPAVCFFSSVPVRPRFGLRPLARATFWCVQDRNPAPLTHLDTLLEQTFQQLIAIGSTMEEEQRLLTDAANRLSCATHLFLLLVRYERPKTCGCMRCLPTKD